jgi:hypothetical protein
MALEKNKSTYSFHYLGKSLDKENYQPVLFIPDSNIYYSCEVVHSYFEQPASRDSCFSETVSDISFFD